MWKFLRVAALAAAFLTVAAGQCRAVELRVSREALERTLRQQLFTGPEGRYYLKGSPQIPCSIYAVDPNVSFAGDRIVVRMKTHARLGKSVRGACLGISLNETSEVSMAPIGEGEILGFRDARLEKISEQRELNFLLTPFLSHTVPAGMQVNAADLLRKALKDSTANSGYSVTLERLKIHSIQIVGDNVVVDVDGDLSIK
jgi:hypothetical protein